MNMADSRAGLMPAETLARLYSVMVRIRLFEEKVLELQKIIFDLKNSGIGILMTDHNVRETLAVTDRAYIINNGRIFRSGTPESLGNDAEVRRVYLGENFSMDLQNGRLQVPASES